MRRPIDDPLQTSHKPRSGSITLEFLIAFPLIFIAVLGIAIFWFYTLVQHAGTTALIEGTRKGAVVFPNTLPLDLAGANNDIVDQIVEVIDKHLRVHNVEVADPANGFPDDPTKQNATVIIERGNGPVIVRPAGGSLNQIGDPIPFTRTGPPPLTSDEIVVSISFELVDASNPSGCYGPVPDWLAPFGFSLQGCTFQMSSRATLE